MKENKITWNDAENLAVEIIGQARHQAKMWFAAFIVALAALIGTNAYWIYVFQSYEYVEQSGAGINNINSGTQGDVTNEPESQN